MEAVVTKKKPKEPKEKPKYNLFQNSAYMISLAWRRQKSVLSLCVILAALAVAQNLLGLFVTPAILGAIESGASVGELVTTILWFAGALVLVGAANGYVGTNTLFGRLQLRLALTGFIHRKISTTSYPNTEDEDVRKKLEKAMSAVMANRSAGEAIWGTLTELLKNVAALAVYLVLISSLELWVAALVLGTTVTGFFVSNYLNGWGFRHRDEEADIMHRMKYIYDSSRNYTLAKDIRIFGMRDWLESLFASAIKLYRAFIGRGERVYIWANVADVVLTFARNGATYIYLIGLVLAGSLSASQFLLYFAAVGGFTTIVSGVLSTVSTLHKQSLDISTVREFVEYDEQFRFEDGEPLEPDGARPYEIELRNVSFRYAGAEKDTLHNIDLTIRAGEKLAIVGLNGAGKTTLVKLACGFYDPTGGEVLLNGRDIRKYNRRDYYRHFSAVFQDFSLLSVTVAENIAQTDVDIDMDKVRSCAERAGIAAKIEGMPDGYETHLGKEVYEDGTELSGGEKQRLMLARALYKDAPVVVLDEPTAALDPIAESDVYNRYNDLTGGRTSVYISHRLASTRFCDRVLYLEDGAIAEEGTHDELVRQGGRYAELFEIQSHYYREGATENEEG